jgi:NADPH-dependent glutamate synthase beta subunit-like oxidoreductase
MSAAYHLRSMGHAVTVMDAGPFMGGMMRFGIPKYRLPREVLDAEMQRIVDMGVTVKLNSKVDNILEQMKAGGFDAAFLAVGAHIGKRAMIPSGDAAKIVDAISVLRSMEGEDKPMLGRRVVVYGGGNTAIDVARSVKRMGAEPIIVYRRTRDKAPAHDFEIEEALQEGVMVKWLSTIKQAGEKEITIEKMALDDKGFPQPTGEFETLEADSVVLALGQDVDLGLLNGVPGLEVTKDGVVKVGTDLMTGHAGIFAGGDMVPAERNVTVAVGHGKKAARNINAWLHGETYAPAPKHEVARFEKLNPWYYADAPKTVRPMLDIIRRQSTFEEVQGGLDEGNALFEARRCLSCGNCFECDNCYGVCPDNAVIKLGPGKRFQFNLDYCKGCGMCVAECPCGAIKMEAEEI